MSAQTVPIEVFLSYAEADEVLCRELEKHLSVLKREGVITTWHKGRIGVGKDQYREVAKRLSAASVIVLLLSADFMASDACYSVEMSWAVERHKAGEAYVVPVVLRPMDDWHNTPIGSLQALPSNGEPVTSWLDSHAAFADVAQGIRSVVQEGKFHPVVAPPPMFPRIWNIPYSRNPVFTGREEILSRIHTQLQTGQAMALSQPQAINGLGGIGKTQIAIEYAYRYRQDYQNVLWTRADTRELLVSGYVTIAKLLNLPEKDEQDQIKAVQAVLQWLSTQKRWLLILDNADELTLAYKFLPPVFGGHLLLTTRAQATGPRAQRIEVESMSQNVGALFLLRRARLLAFNVQLTDAAAVDVVIAKQICEELGGLPLALDQAGAYIEETQCGLIDYQSLYRTRRAEMLKLRGKFSDDYPESVATTWSISFEKVEQRCPAAGDLLKLCAFLAPDAIPEEIITKGAMRLGARLQSVASDSLLLSDAISALGAYSLLHRNMKEKTLSVHRLVQAVVRDALLAKEGKQWMQRAVSAVYTTFTHVEFAQWTACERWLPHALICATWIKQEQMIFLGAARLLNQVAYYLNERVQYTEAELLCKRALTIFEHLLGANHHNTASSLNSLASLYYTQGRYSEAEPLYRRALTIFEQQLGAYHPDTASGLNNLASLYDIQEKYGDAEPLYRRALTIFEQQLGTDHPNTASSLNNLAGLYHMRGEYGRAELLYRQALAIRERRLGVDHPNTASSLNNLASLYHMQGMYAKAETLYRQALAIQERQLGANHPDTAGSLNNLALLYKNQKRYAEAELLYRRAAAIFKQQLGAEHPDTVTSLNNLAGLHKSKQDEALAIHLQALQSHQPKSRQTTLQLTRRQKNKEQPLPPSTRLTTSLLQYGIVLLALVISLFFVLFIK